MSPAYLLDENGIRDMVKNGKALEIVFPILNTPLQDSIHFVVDTILHHYGRVDMKECIYTSLKELVINGIKANIKHVIFKQHRINQENEKSFNRGLDLLKDLMNEKNIGDLEKIAIDKNLHIKLNILHSTDRIILIVENNTPMTANEEKRVREKFEAALKYESIADYYMNNLDDSEGQGIGITMIVLMLKGNQIDPHAFTFDMKKSNSTRAKIEFPIKDPPVISRNTH
jgi:hypothetical protein